MRRARRPRLGRRHHRRAGQRQVDARRRAARRLARRGPPRRRHRHRSVEPDQRRRRARRPHPHGRQRGATRTSSSARSRRAASSAACRARRAPRSTLRRLRLRSRHRRDGRHRPVGDAHRRARRHARRRLPARPRRRRAGDQGRHARDRRRARRQQGRPAARRADRRARCARCSTLRRQDARARGRRASSSSARSRRSGIDELLAALDAHRAACGVGRRAGGARTMHARGAATPAPSSAAGGRRRSTPTAWRDRIAGLAARDGLCATLGIVVRAGGPGRAEVAMTVDARHLNFNGGGHGGAIFALADSAFGLASNSHGPLAAGIDAHITFQAAVAGRRHARRARDRGAAQPAHRRLPDRRRARESGRRRGGDLELHRHGLHQGLTRASRSAGEGYTGGC